MAPFDIGGFDPAKLSFNEYIFLEEYGDNSKII